MRSCADDFAHTHIQLYCCSLVPTSLWSAAASGTGLRDYIHVVDLAMGHVKALEWIAAQPKGVVEVRAFERTKLKLAGRGTQGGVHAFSTSKLKLVEWVYVAASVWQRVPPVIIQ